MSTFVLPDLGEGLPDAEIVEWFVQAGDEVQRDQPMVSVETDKAIVEIPSPQAGRIRECMGEPGDVVQVGDPLVVFESSSAETDESPADTAATEPATDGDRGAVVGEVESSGRVLHERASDVGRGVRATPAVRALARRRDVDLSIVTPTGRDGMVTRADVERAAEELAAAGALEPLRGTRRAMARSMARAHAEVVPVTISDDVDVAAWPDDTDVTLRLARALVAACRSEPSLNAWFDSQAVGRRLMSKIDLGIAVDTEDGLFVPVLRDIGNRDPADLRQGLDRLIADVKARRVPPEELRGYTITLSNFGPIAGRYADPVVVPPTVAILGAGRIRREVVATADGPAVHPVLPISLSFDHRAVTGGEAARFLRTLMEDLVKP